MHKIINVDKSICTKEKKLAYNYLFNTYKHEKSAAIEYIKNHIQRTRDNMKNINFDLVLNYYINFFDKYQDNFFIAFSYDDIGQFFSN